MAQDDDDDKGKLTGVFMCNINKWNYKYNTHMRSE